MENMWAEPSSEGRKECTLKTERTKELRSYSMSRPRGRQILPKRISDRRAGRVERERKIKIFDRNLETVNEDIDPSRDDDLKIIEYKLLSSCTLGSVAKPPGSQTNPGD